MSVFIVSRRTGRSGAVRRLQRQQVLQLEEPDDFLAQHQNPVLADGLFQHTSAFDKAQETDVAIPNINCAKCTLQVIEFMAAHGRNKDGDFTYHHCAVLQIHANPDKPIDTRFPPEKK